MVRLLLVGGKGGVGKTTIAGATAVWAAKSGFKTLLVSSDPAHSTSDSLEQEIGSKPTPIEGVRDLAALEIDLEQEMKELEPLLKDVLNEPFEKIGLSGLDFYSSELMFPGLDEALAFNKLLSFVENPDFDLVIFDTAPTGHTLRFLSLPEILDSWLIKILKFRGLIQKISSFITGKKDTTVEELEKLSKRVKHTRRILADPEVTSFILVSIPEAMAVLETKRAFSILNSYNITAHSLVINNIYPEDCDCRMCSSRREIQGIYLRKIKSEFPAIKLAKVPLFEEEVKGVQMLERVGEILYGNGDSSKQLFIELAPAVAIEKHDGNYLVKISLPAAEKSEIKLRAEKNKLKLNINGIDYQIELPINFYQKNVQAEFKPNLLVVNIIVEENDKSRKIEN